MVTVLSKIRSVKKEGNDIPGVLLLGQRADRKEACEVWVVEEVDSEVILSVMNLSSRVIIDDSLSKWGGNQGDDRLEEGFFLVRVVVPGLSSSSGASSSPASLPQDSSSVSPSPAIQRSDNTHVQASANRGDPAKIKKTKIKRRTIIKQRAVDCEISQSG